jgi:hypothetical protein
MVLLDALDVSPATYTLPPPSTAIAFAPAYDVPSVRLVAVPFFQ